MTSKATPPSPSLDAVPSYSLPFFSALDGFTLFPNLPLELQLNIWKHAISAPGIMQVRCIYPASIKSSGLSQEQRCDAEAMTLARKVEFGTDTKPSGLLIACRLSRQVVLTVLNGCIESGRRKIRFDRDHDIILLHTTSPCCERGLPGIFSRPETIPDYQRIFKDVQYLALSDHALMKASVPTLHSRSRGPTDIFMSCRPWLVSQFRALKILYVLPNQKDWMQGYDSSPSGILFLQTFEEIAATTQHSCQGFLRLQQKYCRNLLSIAGVLKQSKEEWKIDDWTIRRSNLSF
ncbi:hypothetical protein N431DRAFT_552310 [Stipitochalara longipes BDJ]|nr:hypothetical protein N431DRAFT_552310 [Stipitochalara longipes BDJ]